MAEVMEYRDRNLVATRAPRPFLFPESPFQREKDYLGDGFLEEHHPRDRSRDRRRIRAPKPAATYPRWMILTDEQRHYIERTGKETPIEELAEKYGISPYYVSDLRRRYRRRTEDAD